MTKDQKRKLVKFFKDNNYSYKFIYSRFGEESGKIMLHIWFESREEILKKNSDFAGLPKKMVHPSYNMFKRQDIAAFLRLHNILYYHWISNYDNEVRLLMQKPLLKLLNE